MFTQTLEVIKRCMAQPRVTLNWWLLAETPAAGESGLLKRPRGSSLACCDRGLLHSSFPQCAFAVPASLAARCLSLHRRYVRHRLLAFVLATRFLAFVLASLFLSFSLSFVSFLTTARSSHAHTDPRGDKTVYGPAESHA